LIFSPAEIFLSDVAGAQFPAESFMESPFRKSSPLHTPIFIEHLQGRLKVYTNTYILMWK